MADWLKLSLLPAGAVAALWGLDQLLLWAERREWIYYRKHRPKGTVQAGLAAFQSLVEPQIQRIIEDHDGRLAGDTDEEGAPPGKTEQARKPEGDGRAGERGK